MDHQTGIHSVLRVGPAIISPARQDVAQYRNDAPGAYVPLQPSGSNSYPGMPAQNTYPQPTSAQESPEEQSPSAHTGDPNDLKRPRACEACRQLKVKCEPDESNPTGSCKRCAKANRQCIVTAPSRKRQKKTDSRVAELEKKIDALTASLAARGGSDTDPSLDPAITQQPPQLPYPPAPQRTPTYADRWHAEISSSPGPISGVKRKASDDFDRSANTFGKARSTFPPPPSHGMAPPTTEQAKPPIQSQPQLQPDANEAPPFDVIDSGLMDALTTKQCFERYVNEMANNLPLVVFPKNTYWNDIRQNKPILFLAVVTVASGSIKPEIQTRLSSEVSRILADRIVFRGEKSLELVQTLLITALFYQPPERYEELNFNQIIHMAAVMCLDLGMGKRAKKNGGSNWRPLLENKKMMPDPNTAEVRRTWLGCYFLGCNASMSLRRPLFVRWGPYAEECLEILSTVSDSLPSDRWLCHIVRVQHLAEDIGFEYSMDDPASLLTLTDSKTQHHMKAFERRLVDWHDTATADLGRNPLVEHCSGIIGLYMHEIALHHNHNIDDFKPPFVSMPINAGPEPEHVTSAHVDAFSAILSSIHTAFDAFLSLDIRSLRALPILFYVRNSYAAVALIKLFSAISAKNSRYGKIFKLEELRVDYYLENVLNLLLQIAENGLSKIAGKFVIIFTMLKTWHTKRTEPGGSNITLGQSIAKVKAAQGGPLPGMPGPLPPPPPTPKLPQIRSHSTSHATSQEAQSQTWQNHGRSNSSIDPSLGSSQLLPPLPQVRNGLHMLSDAAMAPPHQYPSPSRSQTIPQPSARSPPQYQSSGLSPSQRYQQQRTSPQMHQTQPLQQQHSWLPPMHHPHQQQQQQQQQQQVPHHHLQQLPPPLEHHQAQHPQLGSHGGPQNQPHLSTTASSTLPTPSLLNSLSGAHHSPASSSHSHTQTQPQSNLTNHSDPSTTAPTAPSTTNHSLYPSPTGPNSNAPLTNTNNQQQQSSNVGNVNVGGPYATAPVAPGMIQEYLHMNDFSSDELWALGFGDEFVGVNLNFGFDQGGQWAF